MWVDYKKEILIDHRSTVDIYQQIYSQLEDLLSSAKVLNGQALMEAENLSRLLNVEVEMVNEIYQELKQKRFIYFDDNDIPRVTKYNRFLDFFNEYIAVDEGIKAAGKKATVDRLELKIIELKDDALIDLSKYKDKRFCKQSRLYKADDMPYVYLEEFFPVDRFSKLLDIDRIKPNNIYIDIINANYDVKFVKNKRIIKIEIVKSKIANILKIKEGLSHFTAEMIYYDQNDIPYGYAKAYALPYHYFDYDIKIK